MRSPADTICAIASGTGGGVGVVRVSGPDAEVILRKVAPRLPAVLGSHVLRHVRIVDPESGELVDDALACVMRAPRSYTGENVAEIQAHGGAANLARVLAAVQRAGARLAQPGEFTRRAFLTGRIDLTQAEAVAELIAARSERAARLAQAHLRGAVRGEVERVRERVLAALAEVEAGVDFPDERLDFSPLPALGTAVGEAAREARALADSHRRGRLATSGVDVALVGRANAGKSSLLNAIAGEERALVDAAPGTTRDFLEVEVDLAGLRAVLVDTAGERETGPGLEQRGLELGRKRRERADVVVLVVDGSLGFGAAEAQLLDEVRGREGFGVPVVVAWNKRDLAPVPVGLPSHLPVVATCAASGEGVPELVQALRRAAGDGGADEGVIVTSDRQHEHLASAALSLEAAANALRASAPPELAAVDLRAALSRLGEVTGQSVDGAVLDRIFARFCIGK